MPREGVQEYDASREPTPRLLAARVRARAARCCVVHLLMRQPGGDVLPKLRGLSELFS